MTRDEVLSYATLGCIQNVQRIFSRWRHLVDIKRTLMDTISVISVKHLRILNSDAQLHP